MRELRLATIDTYVATGESLSRQVALMCARLADMLSETPVSRDDPVPAGIHFLRTLAQTASGARAISESVSAGELTPDEPLGRLSYMYGFAPAEVDAMVLAGMAEEHEGLASLFRTLHPRGEPRPTVGLAAQLLCTSQRERLILRELLCAGTAIDSGALQMTGDAPFFERSLQLPDALWPALAGVNIWPAGVHELELPLANAAYGEWLASERAVSVIDVLTRGQPSLLLITADDSDIALHRATALVREAATPAAILTCHSTLSRDVMEKLIPVHGALRGIIPIVVVPESDDAIATAPPQFGSAPMPVMLCARNGSVKTSGNRAILTLHATRLSARARAAAWAAELPELDADARELSARYTLEPNEIRAVAVDTRARAAVHKRAISTADVAASIRTRSDLALASGVRQVHPTAGWDQLVLSGNRTALLREALDRLMHQGRVLDEWGFLDGRPGARGVRMLFAGPPGTGKTLAAEVLAHTFGVDLLVVDISRLVSKWIGETEKNLSEVFDAAERTHAVLLFDEADALFGKRTEVSDAHDRYANLETAYLLARLERFDGLAILSTNLRNNIDPAFTRRLEFVVDFDEPSQDERAAIWRCHLPAAAPLAPDVHMSELASLYPMVGGLIRNASVAAGFTASAANSVITRTDLVRAIRREYEKSGRAFPGAPAGTFTS